ncbi:MAG: hypothetical protein Q4P15_06885 [Propionibacteriaceae bacterium]|nr:hypothetical protein [Propionibacteriaceae bacterium]
MSVALWVIMIAFGISALFVHQKRNVWLRVIFTLAQVGFFLWAWLTYEAVLGSAWLYVFLAFVLLGTFQQFLQRRRQSATPAPGRTR